MRELAWAGPRCQIVVPGDTHLGHSFHLCLCLVSSSLNLPGSVELTTNWCLTYLEGATTFPFTHHNKWIITAVHWDSKWTLILESFLPPWGAYFCMWIHICIRVRGCTYMQVCGGVCVLCSCLNDGWRFPLLCWDFAFGQQSRCFVSKNS